MQILSIFLIVYGAVLLAGLLLQFPFIYNNMKSRAIIAKIGKRGFNLMLLIVGLVALIAGIILIN
jgi:hypothetical protein